MWSIFVCNAIKARMRVRRLRGRIWQDCVILCNECVGIRWGNARGSIVLRFEHRCARVNRFTLVFVWHLGGEETLYLPKSEWNLSLHVNKLNHLLVFWGGEEGFGARERFLPRHEHGDRVEEERFHCSQVRLAVKFWPASLNESRYPIKSRFICTYKCGQKQIAGYPILFCLFSCKKKLYFKYWNVFTYTRLTFTEIQQ